MAHVRHPPSADEALVDEASRESFPASDAPCWTPTHAGAPAVVPVSRAPRELRNRLRADVDALELDAGARREHAQRAVADYIATAFLDAGRSVTRIPLPHEASLEDIEVVIRGREGPELVVGARYGACAASPDDLASAPAILIALARLLEGRSFSHSVRFVAFPFDRSRSGAPNAGARAYAKRLERQGVHLAGMVSLESVGYLSDRHRADEGSAMARLFIPWTGDFVAFVGDRRSRRLARAARDAFRLGSELPAHAIAMPAFLPVGRVTDHRPFWRLGYPAIAVTDSGLFRSRPLRHEEIPAVHDYDRMADVVFGLSSVVTRLAGEPIQ